MSQENIEIVRRFMRACSDHDRAAMAASSLCTGTSTAPRRSKRRA
jgi:hypothetical protein